MRQFLYITPYFPPQTQVGALRPLKLVRQLPALGWQPVVLCDLWPSDGMDAELERFVPEQAVVVRDYSHRAGPTWRRLHRYAKPAHAPRPQRVPKGRPLHERLIPRGWMNPELVPLGEHSPDMPWAYTAALRVLDDYPDIAAIVVNADPFAAAIVGALLHDRTGLPLVQDFRDIWAPCKLRRPRRPKPWRWLEDALERYCLDRAAHAVINTQTSLDDYRAFYPDLPVDRFSLLRNFFDADLVDHGDHPGYDRFTLLHLGNFSRFRVADPLVRAVARALELGVPREAIQVATTGPFGQAARELAALLGVADLIHAQAEVAYHQTGAVCAAADLLVYIAEPAADQRIASKFYDYLGSGRPLLSISDNPESAAMIAGMEATAQFSFADIEGMARFVVAQVRAGRHRAHARPLQGLTAAEAGQRYAQILDAVAAGRSVPPVGA
ncbi:MAG: hypothetical protein FJ100_17330 [Deltaproteobacteria bacterium]|nr:hypothetical protein [Deltaproteobacteria bacterium]